MKRKIFILYYRYLSRSKKY